MQIFKCMMLKPGILFILLLLLLVADVFGQSVEVQANYNNVGDVDFIAYNNTAVPQFIQIDFADLENTTFDEPLPYVKMVVPGFNSLFTLQRDFDAGPPRFNYRIRSYRSNPVAKVNLDFPYLLPFEPGTEVAAFDVKNISGFMGAAEPKGWLATGFMAEPGQEVFASRNGIVVEVTGPVRSGEPLNGYQTWPQTVTLLQPDGTLICYRNVTDKNKILVPGEKVFAGQKLGEVAPGATGLILMIYHHILDSDDLLFVIPRFVVATGKVEMLTSSSRYQVIHPLGIRGLEMEKKEKRRLLQ